MVAFGFSLDLSLSLVILRGTSVFAVYTLVESLYVAVLKSSV